MTAEQFDLVGDLYQIDQGSVWEWWAYLKNENQVITVGGAPPAGTLQLQWTGRGPLDVSEPIAYNAVAGTVLAAIQRIPSIGNGGVQSVTGPAGGPWVVTLDPLLIAETGNPLFTANPQGLAPYGGTVGVTRQPYDLTGHIARMHIRQNILDVDPPLATATTANGKITIDAANGIVKTKFTDDDTAAFVWVNPAHYDLEVEDAAGSVFSPYYGAVYLRLNVTR